MLKKLAPISILIPVAIAKNDVTEGRSRMKGRGSKMTIPHQPGQSSLYRSNWVFNLKGRRSALCSLLCPAAPNKAAPNLAEPCHDRPKPTLMIVPQNAQPLAMPKA